LQTTKCYAIALGDEKGMHPTRERIVPTFRDSSSELEQELDQTAMAALEFPSRVAASFSLFA
jgi:hypothetical protein